MEVVTPRSLDEALALKAEHPEAVPIQGGTDLLVELNFDRRRPETILNLAELGELRGWSREDGSPQIRNRGTIGGNLGTASPAGDALPPLLAERAEVEVASVRGTRRIALDEFLVGPKRNALAPDELILGVVVRPSGGPQTFMKVGPRNAMVIAIASLAVVADGERAEVRAAFGSCGPVAGVVTCGWGEAESLPERVVDAAQPIDDVRGTAAYRRHALRVLAERALERCLA
jgi:CO/xanthine dehydrogenase FAD-binding subunit